MAPMNLAGVLPWTYGRAFIVVALLAAGNLFCMACPFTLPRELGRRLGLATRHWPRALRTKWLAVGLLVLFFWAYEAFDLWDSPSLTAWILVGYFVAAFAVDTFFRGASFCKYVCPIGQFNFVSSLVSPLEVRVRSRDSLHRLRDSRLPPGQPASTWLRTSPVSSSQSGQHGLHVLPGLRKGMPARQHRHSRTRSRTRPRERPHSIVAGALLTPPGYCGAGPRGGLFGICECGRHGGSGGRMPTRDRRFRSRRAVTGFCS